MRKIFFVIPLSLTALAATSCDSFKEPTFEKSKGLSLVAYSGPTSKAVGLNTATDEQFKAVADAGFTHILALYDGHTRTGTTLDETFRLRNEATEYDAKIAMDFCAKYGLKYYARDWNLYGMSRDSSADSNIYKLGINGLTPEDAEGTGSQPQVSSDPYGYAMERIFPDDCEYIHHPAFAGSYIFDEPSYFELKELGKVIDAFQARMKELNIETDTYFNLYPANVNISALGPNGYEGYVNRYVNEIGKKVGYLCYDFYPLMRDAAGNYLKGLHLYNLQQGAKACANNNLELRTYIQTGGDFTGMRDFTSIADFRFQLYANLAFGSQYITYYQYSTKTNSEQDGEFGILNLRSGKLSWTYDCCKAVNAEIKSLADPLSAYRYDNVMYMSKDPRFVSKNFTTLIDPLTHHDRVSIESVSEDTYMTCFKGKKDNSDAFMLCNYSEPSEGKTDTVTLKFKKARALLMYRLGRKMIVNLPLNGEYTFKLCPGEGRFIIPLN